MPTTPNYGWDTPADTDYVTNGALSIRTMADDADATVYSVQTTLNASKVAKAGDTMTGPLVVLNNAAAGRGLCIQQDAATDSAILQILNDAGVIQQGYLRVNADNQIILAMSSNGSTLTLDNVGNTIRDSQGITRVLPFASQVGTATVAANSFATITFHTSRFALPPIVTATPNSVTTSAITWHVGSVTATNFRLYNTSSSTRDFYWNAVQMAYSDSAG